MRSSLITRGLSATAAVLLLAACSGGGSDDEAASSSTSAASSSSAEPSEDAPEAGSEFCTQADQITENLSSSLAESDATSLSDNLQAVSDEIGKIDPPAEIADDWDTLAEALGDAAGALDGVDLTDPDQQAKAQADLAELQSKVGDAGTNVEAYLRDQCGIDTDGTETPTDTAAPSS